MAGETQIPVYSNGESSRRSSTSSRKKVPTSADRHFKKKSSSLMDDGSGGKKGKISSESRLTMSVTMTSGDARSAEKALPGRPRRRGNRISAAQSKIKRGPKQSIRYRLMNARWMKFPMKDHPSSSVSLVLAVGLWYSLGVVSITTSNLLMMKATNHVGNVPPLYLTLQQLIIGTTLLRSLLGIGFMGSRGIQPWPSPSAAAQAAEEKRRKSLLFNQRRKPTNGMFSDFISSNLVMAGICFALGFLATNNGFLSSSAAFVETVKAAEPITSAAIAVMWGIENLGGPEVLSLGCIVTGVLISTLAHGAAKSSTPSSVSTTLMQSLQSCAIVMVSNLCFSFRGLYQKLFRASPEGSPQAVDDLNLQLRMQQIGVLLLVVPVVVFDLPGLFGRVWEIHKQVGLFGSGVIFRYLGLAIANGVAFTSYNLASTYILSRISVVHHAALNCIRRIFAIIVTSMYFRIQITVMGVIGFFISFGGFMSFTHYKIQRQKQPKPLSSLLPVSAAGGASLED